MKQKTMGGIQMPTAACLKNIQSEKPPYNVPCTDAFCHKTSFARGQHCSTRGLPLDTPVLSWDPDLNGGQACYCCCSCFALDTPIEAAPGQFVLIQNIQAGDTIMAADKHLNWKPAKVRSRSGDIDPSLVPGLYYVSYQLANEKDPRHLLVTPDHLFLMSTSRTLKKVQHLIPGDKLAASDGSVATVRFVVAGEHYTSIQSIEMEAPFNPDTLEGHLLNSNGVVSADYTIQVMHETGNLDSKLLYSFDSAKPVYEAGTEEYNKRFGTAELRDFLQDESRWPKGFAPRGRQLLQIPKIAESYFTAQQAKDILENGEFTSMANGVGRDNVQFLFRLIRAENPKITCLLDWDNPLPNAYAWRQYSQQYLLITGGLVRLKGMYLESLSIVTAYLQAYLNGSPTVAEADYASINVLRDLYPDQLLAGIVPEGIQQLQSVYDLVNQDNKDGDELRPGLDCRIRTYWNSFSFFGLPECAQTRPAPFEIRKAYASFDLSQVIVVFSDEVDPATGQDAANYSIVPDVKVAKAEIDPANSKTVVLDVEGLQNAGTYLLSVGAVTSAKGVPLDPNGNAVIIRTP
jgi:hypothetical protein